MIQRNISIMDAVPSNVECTPSVGLHVGVVNRVRRGVGEPKEVVIHGRGDVIEVRRGCRYRWHW